MSSVSGAIENLETAILDLKEVSLFNDNENKAFLKSQMAQYYLKIEHIPEAYKFAKKIDGITAKNFPFGHGDKVFSLNFRVDVLAE